MKFTPFTILLPLLAGPALADNAALPDPAVIPAGIATNAVALRDRALEEISKPEVTRFKGLGEISPKEFKQFIADGDMRLVQVQVRPLCPWHRA